MEDIIDIGFMFNKVCEILKFCELCLIVICIFLDKLFCWEVEVFVEWVGFIIFDEFVVGFGIDYV